MDKQCANMCKRKNPFRLRQLIDSKWLLGMWIFGDIHETSGAIHCPALKWFAFWLGFYSHRLRLRLIIFGLWFEKPAKKSSIPIFVWRTAETMVAIKLNTYENVADTSGTSVDWPILYEYVITFDNTYVNYDTKI